MTDVDIQRCDPTGVPPSDDPSTNVPLTAPDRAVIVLGTKMFGASNVGFFSRSDQLRRIGYKSNGVYGSSTRTMPSHGHTIIVGFDVVSVPGESLKKIDQIVKDQMADLIFRKLLIVTPQGGTRLTPDQMRNYT
jgi:hypothetical protein